MSKKIYTKSMLEIAQILDGSIHELVKVDEKNNKAAAKRVIRAIKSMKIDLDYLEEMLRQFVNKK